MYLRLLLSNCRLFQRRERMIMKRRYRQFLQLTAAAALLLAGSCVTSAQQASLKEQLIGTWTTVSQYTILKDGQREELYGAKPIGSLMFDRNGRFSYILFNPAR